MNEAEEGTAAMAAALSTVAEALESTSQPGSRHVHTDHFSLLKSLSHRHFPQDEKRNIALYKSRLSLAVKEGNVREVDRLLKDGHEVNQLSYWKGIGEPPLVTAIRHKHKRLVPLLLMHGADVNLPSDKGYTALIRAAQKDFGNLVTMLLNRNADPNCVDCNNLSALYWAVKHQNSQSVTELVKAGADVNMIVQQHSTVLHIAAGTSNVGITEALLNHGACINARDDFGETPIFYAVKVNSYDITSTLLKRGAEVNVANLDYRTPMHMAAASVHNNFEITQLLLDKGAVVNMPDRYSNIPLVHSLRNYILCPSYKIAKCLIQHGSDLNYSQSVHSFEWTLMTHANFELLKFAVKAGFKLFGVKWLQEFMSRPPSRRHWYTRQDYDIEKEKSFITFVKSHLNNAQPLQELCRIAIRNHLVCVCDGRSTLYKMRELPLPLVMISYLSLEDEVDL